MIGSFRGRQVAMAIFRQTENGMADGVVHMIGTSSSKQVPEFPSRAAIRAEDKVPMSQGMPSMTGPRRITGCKPDTLRPW
ncbi:hypothetical protein A5675_01650 [Mycobacterium malmoense]|nr:hypothetical protein A5675_01650 [Mycobacterium malmoense]